MAKSQPQANFPLASKDSENTTTICDAEIA